MPDRENYESASYRCPLPKEGDFISTEDIIQTLDLEARFRPTMWGDARPLLKEAAARLREAKSLLETLEAFRGEVLLLSDHTDKRIQEFLRHE